MKKISLIPPGPGNPYDTPIMDPVGITRKFLDLSYTPDKPHPMRKLDMYLPEEGGGPFPILIYMHGGGFTGGLKNDFHAVSYLEESLKAGFAFASVEQRLCAPQPDGSYDAEGRFPGSLFDLKAAIRFLRANAEQYLLDPARFALLGPSAGGYHVAMAAATQDVPAMYDDSFGFGEVSGKVQAVVDLFGVSDLVMQAEFSEKKHSDTPKAPGQLDNHDSFFGAKILQHTHLAWIANPLFWVTADMPPFLIQTGAADQVVTVECSRSLAKRIEAVCGKSRVEYDEFPDYGHGDERFHDPANHARIFGWLKEKLA
ncbi:MAG: alpha/beta hydrolase [Clostridiales bacterium]|nr:alpha/beta hydrolase [Clostridiales bacterium]